MPSHASAERAALVGAMRAAGPDALTLCEGWTVRDLAGHVVARERRPDSGPGIMLPAFAGWTDHVRRGYTRRPFGELLDMIASGPPITSPFALPGADAALNLAEFFVHCEDVRRAAPEWEPRRLPAERRAALWRIVSARGRYFYRGCPVGLELAVPNGPHRVVRTGEPHVVLTGEAPELLLHAFGRGDHARVDVSGPAAAVERFRTVHPHV